MQISKPEIEVVEVGSVPNLLRGKFQKYLSRYQNSIDRVLLGNFRIRNE